jgi:hypothetical protein
MNANLRTLCLKKSSSPQQGVDRMKGCGHVDELARDLVIQRKLL